MSFDVGPADVVHADLVREDRDERAHGGGGDLVGANLPVAPRDHADGEAVALESGGHLASPVKEL